MTSHKVIVHPAIFQRSAEAEGKDSSPGRGTVGIFFNRRGKSHTVVMPGADIADRAATSSLPDLLPVTARRQACPAHVFAVLDHAGADIIVHPGEGAGAMPG